MELGELKATLSKVRIVLSDDEVAQVLQKYDADASGTISEDEWHTLLGDLLDGTLTFFSPAATKSKKAKGGGDKGGPIDEFYKSFNPTAQRHKDNKDSQPKEPGSPK